MNINELITYLNEFPSSGFAVHCYDEDDDFSDDDDWVDTASPYTRNDGGRAASGRKGSAGDCGVRAMGGTRRGQVARDREETRNEA